MRGLAKAKEGIIRVKAWRAGAEFTSLTLRITRLSGEGRLALKHASQTLTSATAAGGTSTSMAASLGIIDDPFERYNKMTEQLEIVSRKGMISTQTIKALNTLPIRHQIISFLTKKLTAYKADTWIDENGRKTVFPNFKLIEFPILDGAKRELKEILYVRQLASTTKLYEVGCAFNKGGIWYFDDRGED